MKAKTPTRIIILGPPGSGKGTQGEFLSKTLDLPRLSVGALLRRQYQEKTDIGLQARKYTEKGLAVPGDLLIHVLDSWFKKHPEGFIVDNLIRSKDQLRAFTTYQKTHDFPITVVLQLEISKTYALERIQRRRKGRAVRDDETEEAINKRFEVYNTWIGPIISYLQHVAPLCIINAEQPKEAVHKEIMRCVEEVLKQ